MDFSFTDNHWNQCPAHWNRWINQNNCFQICILVSIDNTSVCFPSFVKLQDGHSLESVDDCVVGLQMIVQRWLLIVFGRFWWHRTTLVFDFTTSGIWLWHANIRAARTEAARSKPASGWKAPVNTLMNNTYGLSEHLWSIHLSLAVFMHHYINTFFAALHFIIVRIRSLVTRPPLL